MFINCQLLLIKHVIAKKYSGTLIQNTFQKILAGYSAYISFVLYFEKCVPVFSRHFSRLLYVISSLVWTGLLLLLPVAIYSNGSAIFFYLNSVDHIMSWLNSSDPESVVSLTQWEMLCENLQSYMEFDSICYDLQCHLYCNDILASSSRSTIFFIDFMSLIQICICSVFLLVVRM